MQPIRPVESLLVVENLRIGIPRRWRGPLLLVDKADFDLRRGEMLGLVGESGSGKTMVCRSIIGTLARRGAAVLSGSIRLAGVELAHAGEALWRTIRGRRVGYITQSALAGLNPVMSIGMQLGEAIRQSGASGHAAVRERALELLEKVQIRRPRVVLDQHPHQLSGGMRQRVMIACALATRPDIIVADEPTTGLDVTVQAEIMRLLRRVQLETGAAVLLVSHDLALIDAVCDRLVVMHAGTCVESGAVDQMARPQHPYTAALNRSRIELAPAGSELVTIRGRPPAVGGWSPGCRFAERCEIVADDCRSGPHPPLRAVADGHLTACLRPHLVEGLR
ncbi:MAG: ABC transporter ATP-binding protein [Alphaproteobacteria bacterium]|nr:ABC transporter ATP-binding protein [Alphaproteobacteria bacterium]